jgi:predicted RNA-binding Zn-ribbon protein involved in translation (DUF1610 family)
MIRSIWTQGEIQERLAEKGRGYKGVYLASKEDLNKYLSMGCSVSGCGGDIELLRDEKMPELVEGYRCRKCGLAILYDGYIFHLEE